MKAEAMNQLVIRDHTTVGIAVPQMFPPGPTDLALIKEHLTLVEALGYESVWTQHGVFATSPNLDPFTLLAFAASCTRTIKLGISVVVLPYHDPVNVAKISASLDQISGGRLILGVGIGGDGESYPAFGFDASHRIARFEDAVTLIRRLWAEPSVDFQNNFWNLENVSINPKPVQKPHIPIWFGASADSAVERAAKMGDGFMGAGAANASDIAAFRKVLAKLRSALEENGRDPATFPISKRVYLAIDDDRESANRKIQQWFLDHYHSAELGMTVSLIGSVDEIVDKLGPLAEEGLDMIMFNPVYNLIEHAQVIAERVVPQL